MKYFLWCLFSFHLLKNRYCQLQVNVYALNTGNLLSLRLSRKSVVRLTDFLHITINVDRGVKTQTKQTKENRNN